MTRLELANIIIKGGDFEFKSHHFGNCVMGINQHITFYEADNKIKDAVIARFRKDCIANYLDYISNPNKRNNITLEIAEQVDNEGKMLDGILTFIGVESAK